MTNVEQQEAWNGISGESWVRQDEKHDGQLVPWAELLAATAAVQPGERVLDIGCGCGATTIEAARRAAPDGQAIGVDLSGPMTARAREKAVEAGLTNTRFEVGDAQTDDLTLGDAPYDVVISRFGVMFFEDPVAAFANMHKATRPGGRLAMVAWAPIDQQQWIRVPMQAALAHVPLPPLLATSGPGMFGLADHDGTVSLLREAGWDDIAIEPHLRTMLLGGGGTLDETLTFLLNSGIGRALFAQEDVPAEALEKGTAAARDALAEHLTPEGVTLDGTAVMITARR